MLGEALVKKGIITKRSLNLALRVQKERGGREPIGRILVKEGYCNLEDVLQVLGTQTASEDYTPFLESPEEEALRSIPSIIARTYNILPIKIDSNGKLVVVVGGEEFFNRLDEGWDTKVVLEEMLGIKDIKYLVGESGYLERKINEHYRNVSEEEYQRAIRSLVGDFFDLGYEIKRIAGGSRSTLTRILEGSARNRGFEEQRTFNE